MRRPLAVLSVSACAALVGPLLVAAPAHAAGSTVRMQYTFPDTSTAYGAFACTEGAQPDPGAGRFDLSDVGPSMKVSGFPAGTAGGFTHTGPSLAAEPFLQYSRYAPTGALTRIVFEFSEAHSTTTWRGEILTNSGPGWQVGDPMAATYTWLERDAHGVPTGRQGHGTPAVLRQSEGLADGSFRVDVGLGCEGETVYFDQIRYGAESDQTRLDFERFRTEIPASASRSLTAGGATTLSTVIGARDDVSREPERLRGAQLVLEQAQGEGWVDLATVTGSLGADDYSALVAPSSTTTYRWRFVGNAGFDDAVSAPFTVTVTPRMTPPMAPTLAAAPAKSKVKKGKQIVVEGLLTPADPGATVTLWRARGANERPLGTGVVALDGRFRLTATARKPGRLTLYVTGGSATSPTFTVKVRPRRR